MAVIKGVARQSSSVSRAAEGGENYLKMLRDGSISVADMVAAWGLEGRIFTLNAGSVTTPITFGAGSITETEYDVYLKANSGFQIVPLSIQLQMEAYGTTALFEAMAKLGAGGTVGAGTSVTPVCTNTQVNRGPSCTCTVAATATSGVALTSGFEFWRVGSQKTVTRATVTEVLQDPMRFTWSWKDSGVLNVGPELALYASAQAGTGFFIVTYAELPTSSVN